jgi:hypothetical protein
MAKHYISKETMADDAATAEAPAALEDAPTAAASLWLVIGC